MTKQQQPDSSKYDTSAHSLCVYQVSIFQASQFLRKEWWKISMLKIGEEEKWIKGWISSSSLILIYIIYLPTVHVCTNFQSSGPHRSGEKCDEKFQCWKLERKKNEEIKGQISSSSLIQVYMIHLPTFHVCTKFQSSRPHSSWEKCDKIFQCWKLERKKNEDIMRWISSSSLILVHMIYLPTVYVCTKFQSSRPHSSWEKCDEKFQCWKLERKMNIGMNKQQQPESGIHDTSAHCPRVFQSSRPHNSLEECDKKISMLKIGEKEKWRNKGTNKKQHPDSGIHDTSADCPCVYQFSIF